MRQYRQRMDASRSPIMSTAETRAIVIINSDGASAAAILHVRRFDTRDRLLRALGTLALMWLLALLTVAIPVAHFVLVPALLLAGPVLAWRRYRVTEQNERVDGVCPTCSVSFTRELDASDRLPLWTYCPPADHPIQLVEAPQGAGRQD